MKRLTVYRALIYILIPFFTSCAAENHENSGAAWGTSYHIVYSGSSELGDSIVEVMNRVEDELSMFKASSTVSRINRGEDVKPGQMFAEVFAISKNVSRLSRGAFDPTVGPLTNLWGFGTLDTDSLQEPSDSLICKTLPLVGIDSCFIVGGRVIKKHPQTTFDFSSVAKGYGVDAVAAMLARNGCDNYLVEIGGEIRASGLNSRGEAWRIQIDSPESGLTGHKRLRVISLDNASVASSGNYRNYRETARGRIGHTIDPATGRPVASATASATVIARECATADALATACMVMNADSALAMIEAIDGAEALISVISGDSLAVRTTSGFPK